MKTPLAVIVVDSVNQKPTDNLPSVAESLPVSQAPAEFEVADVRQYSPRNIRIACNHAGLTHYGGVYFFHEFLRVLRLRHFWPRT